MKFKATAQMMADLRKNAVPVSSVKLLPGESISDASKRLGIVIVETVKV